MNPYFKNLLDLVRLERKVDEELYDQFIRSAPVQQQREAGYAWYPIALRGQDVGRGDYLVVEIERPSHQHIVHNLQSGRKAELFSNAEPNSPAIKGIIQHIQGDRLRMAFRIETLPDWANKGKLGIRALFDDDSYDAMEAALKTAGTPDQTHPLVPILTGKKPPSFDAHIPTRPFPGLNASQNEAVNLIEQAKELAIVHGPPGTGKTTTLVAAIQRLLTKTTKPILVVAPSNIAVDLLCERLSEKQVRVVRIGNPIRVSDDLQALTLDHRVSEHPDFKRIKELKKQASELRNMAHRYKRNFGPAERSQRKALFAEAGRISHDVAYLEDFIIEDELHKAQVIAATPVGTQNFALRDLSFDTVIIDEAGQALEPACWIPILKANKVVFAGDHLQLPPTVKSEEAARRGLTQTLMEKCVAYYPEATVLLKEQYRMNKIIMGFSSQYFYGNNLLAHDTVAESSIYRGDPPMEFIDTAGCGFEEQLSDTSYVNPEEADFLVKFLTEYLEKIKSRTEKLETLSVGVISPYKHQVELLKQRVTSQRNAIQGANVMVHTIDGFQGQERDIIVIGMVRSNVEGRTGFLNETRRMNVAMTRARKKLVIIGDSATLTQTEFYEDVLEYVRQKGSYRSAWEFASF